MYHWCMVKASGGGDHRSLPLLDYLARVGRRSAEASTPGGLRPRHLHALGILSERGPLSQRALGGSLSLDPSNVVGLLNELEERGLITRRRDPRDRRCHIVELSPTGAEALASASSRLASVEDGLLAGLSAEERSTLYHLLVRAAGTESPPCEATDHGTHDTA